MGKHWPLPCSKPPAGATWQSAAQLEMLPSWHWEAGTGDASAESLLSESNQRISASCFSRSPAPSHCSASVKGEMLLFGFKRKDSWAGGPLQVTINAHDNVVAELNLVDFDGEVMKALNEPWEKTSRHRDFIKINCLFWCLIKYKKSNLLLSPEFWS